MELKQQIACEVGMPTLAVLRDLATRYTWQLYLFPKSRTKLKFCMRQKRTHVVAMYIPKILMSSIFFPS